MEPENQYSESQTRLEDLIDNVKDCINTKSKIVVLKATDKVSGAAGSAVSGIIFAFIAVIIVILLSIGLAHYISVRSGDSFSGFFYVAGGYAVLLLILFLGRNAIIKRPIANKIISEMLND